MSDTVIHHNKLVRDRIPEIIRNAGKVPVTRLASPDEMTQLLRDKLTEEMTECQAAIAASDPLQISEEIADVLEVLHAIAERSGISWEAIEATQLAKCEKRGAFRDGVILLSVLEPEDTHENE